MYTIELVNLLKFYHDVTLNFDMFSKSRREISFFPNELHWFLLTTCMTQCICFN